MRTLDRKLARDLWHMKGQALAIVLVIVSGVATFVMLRGSMHALERTRDRFYRDAGFAHVFASLKRAPERLRARIGELPGVDQVETRVVADVKLDLAGFQEPVTGKVVSVPDHGAPRLNRLFLRAGRMVAPGRDDEVVVSEAFAEVHGFTPGDSLGAIINGRRKTLRIVGIALSPEFVLQVRPGTISPDYKRYAILWMGRRGLATAYDMDGAFNDVTLTLTGAVQSEDVIRRVDAVLDRYGGLGAYDRSDQLSNRYLTEEFHQLRRSATIFPTIFISVAAFLLHVVVSRTVGTQREQIGILKAFGYRPAAIALHYVKLVVVIVLLGVSGGLGVGAWLGRGLAELYTGFFRFPFLHYRLDPSVAAAATIVCTGAALVGTLHAVWKAVRLSPAEAMRPESPLRYRQTVLDRLGLTGWLSLPTLIIARNVGRRPVRTLLSVTGIALACAVMIAGRFSKDAIDFMVDVQFRRASKEDMTVTLTEPTSQRAQYELAGLPGVERVEAFRSVPVRFSFGHRTYRTTIEAQAPDSRLHLLLDTRFTPMTVPPAGIVLTDYLGKLLGVTPGDTLTVEILEGARPVRRVAVVGLVRQYIGVMGYMDLAALNRLMREGHAVSGLRLTVDAREQHRTYRTLVEMPRVAGAAVRGDEIRNFYETQAEFLLFFTFVATILAGTIAVGVVYNNARIALSERSRELASLRVLGYTRAEISYILLGELCVLVLAAIPPGFLLGHGLAAYIAVALQTDLFRVPVVIEPATYALAAAVVLASTGLSGLLVGRRLQRLDLIAALKARE